MSSENNGIVYHVSKNGRDDHNTEGSPEAPFLTIGRAAQFAYAGDTIVVHEGVYRERVTPPRGGASDRARIVYRAAEGEKAEIRGSEIATGWEALPECPSVWKTVVENAFFGNFNPFAELIDGDWFEDMGRDHHLGDVFLHGQSLYEVASLAEVLEPKSHPTAWGDEQKEFSRCCWYAEADETQTVIWMNIGAFEAEGIRSSDVDPNDGCVEVSVRDSCFYPDMPGRNYITVKGFVMRHAATNWAAPTAEQIGLIGTHWSKGWIIEDNTLSDSRCSGITLGKDRTSGHNEYGNRSLGVGADVYTEVIKRAQDLGWHKDNIGSHIVRNNTISNCEMAGICGSMGAIFSEISGNNISRIHVKSQFTGAEMAGIKIHGAIDCLIKKNTIRSVGYHGIWLDWMAQGAIVTENCISECRSYDLFLEVNFGPNLIDNNRFLSEKSILSWSEGGVFCQNYIAGLVTFRKEPRRLVPRMVPHSTQILDMGVIEGGSEYYLNNVFRRCEGDVSQGDASARLRDYRECKHPVHLIGNTFE